MSGKRVQDPYTTKEFMRISSYCVKKLQSNRQMTQFSKIKLKKLQDKIKDLKDSSLPGNGQQELKYEISTDILSSENATEMINADYARYFSAFVSSFKSRNPLSFPSAKATSALIREYDSVFEFQSKLEANEKVQKWKVLNKNEKRESMLTIHLLTAENKPENFISSFDPWRTLDHKNILRLTQIYPHEKSYGVETEFAEQWNIAQSSKSLKPEEALFASYQIADGLEYAHSKGIEHCYINPANITVAASGTLKITNWNLGALIKTGNPALLANSTDILYAAPEILDPRKEVASKASDVFGLALITANLLLGDLYGSTGNNVKSAGNVHSKLIENLRSTGTVESELKDFLLKALSIKPEDRGTMAQFKSLLGKSLKFTQEISVANTPTVPSPNEPGEAIATPQASVAARSEEGKVTKIEISVLGTQKTDPMSGEKSDAIALRQTVDELKRLLEKENYTMILQTIKNREQQLIKTYPHLRQNFDDMKLNLAPAIKFPTVPHAEINSRVQDLITALESQI